jgi:hypothetical protein
MPSELAFRLIRLASSDPGLTAVSARGRLPSIALAVDCVIYEILPFFYNIGKNAGLGKDSAGSDYLLRRQLQYITSVIEIRNREKRENNLTV